MEAKKNPLFSVGGLETIFCHAQKREKKMCF